MSGYDSSHATPGTSGNDAYDTYDAYDKAISRFLVVVGTAALLVAVLASVITAGG